MWFNLLSIALTLGLLVILGFWHWTELRRGAEDYRRTMEELGYDWYERFNLPFLVLDELFTLPQAMDPGEEKELIRRRWQFWAQHSDYPGLIKTVLRVGRSPSPEQITIPPAAQGHPSQASDWAAVVGGVSARLGAATSVGQRHMLCFVDSIPYLVINYGQPVYHVLVLDAEVFYAQFIKQVTLQVMPKIRTTLSGFSPAVLHVGETTTVLYCPAPGITLSRWYSLFFLDDRSDQGDQTSAVLDKAKTASLQQLQLGTSYFLKIWLNRAATTDNPPPPIMEESFDLVSPRKGVFFAFLPHRGSIETVVFLKNLPLFALGYGALALMGFSLLTASGYNRKMIQLLIRQEEFVATMTHELRTPLHIITNGASNLSDGIVSKSDEVARYGALLHAEALRLSEMVESILNFADVTNRQPVLHEIDLHRLIDEVLAPYRLICREQHLQLDEHCSTQPACVGDPEAIRLILSNLLSNAIKHAGSGKWIGVSISAGAELTILVQDRGPGIPKREIPKVTDPFFRSHRQRNGIQGNGLGLSIVKRIAEVEKGSLVITSEEGKGSSFLVKLPYQGRELKYHV